MKKAGIGKRSGRNKISMTQALRKPVGTPEQQGVTGPMASSDKPSRSETFPSKRKNSYNFVKENPMVQENFNESDLQTKGRRGSQSAKSDQGNLEQGEGKMKKMVTDGKQMLSEGVDQISDKISGVSFDWKTILAAVGVIGGIGAASAYAIRKQGRSGRSSSSHSGSHSGQASSGGSSRRGRRASSSSSRAH